MTTGMKREAGAPARTGGAFAAAGLPSDTGMPAGRPRRGGARAPHYRKVHESLLVLLGLTSVAIGFPTCM
jgi:hypothetical protein